MIRRTALLAVIATAPACLATEMDGNPAFQCGGETLAQDWRVAARDIEDKESAQKLADAIFCAPESTASSAFLRSHLDASVLISTSSTGDREEHAAVPREKIGRLPMFNAAKDRQFHVRADSSKLILETSNEACLDTVTLVYDKTWLVTGYESACD
ncbi:hypothetical protein [[Pseudomonas] boreopolis]|uniref:hypothetical protein n=1 Tax=Xanthomonas boreopolis TaxID=86183 RepID=UPI003DA071F4